MILNKKKNNNNQGVFLELLVAATNRRFAGDKTQEYIDEQIKGRTSPRHYLQMKTKVL